MSTTRLIAFDPATTINANDVLYIAQGNAEKKLTFSALAAAVAAAFPPGQGAYTTTTADFVQPIALANVTVQVVSTAWMAATEPVLIPGGGYYRVVSITDSTHAVLQNLGFTGNAAPTSTVSAGAKVSAVGERGLTGSTGPTGDTGATGPAGAAATIAIGTVTTLPAGSSATVTNVGTSSAAVLNIGIPKGADGTGTGTVTSASVASANGFAGTVANASTTPAITLTTTVTSGKLLKAGSSGAMIAATAGTDYAAAPTGTALQLLANDGSGGTANVTLGSGLTLSAGTLTASGGGAWTKISTLTASSSASLDWTGLSGYSRYAILVEDIVAANATQVLALRFGTGGTPTWITSGYLWQVLSVTGSTSTPVQSTSGTYFNLGGYASGGVPSSAPGCSGLVMILGALTSTPSITADTTCVNASGPSAERTAAGGAISAGAAISAIRLLMSAGNIVSGTATLYGIN